MHIFLSIKGLTTHQNTCKKDKSIKRTRIRNATKSINEALNAFGVDDELPS